MYGFNYDDQTSNGMPPETEPESQGYMVAQNQPLFQNLSAPITTNPQYALDESGGLSFHNDDPKVSQALNVPRETSKKNAIASKVIPSISEAYGYRKPSGIGNSFLQGLAATLPGTIMGLIGGRGSREGNAMTAMQGWKSGWDNLQDQNSKYLTNHQSFNQKLIEDPTLVEAYEKARADVLSGDADWTTAFHKRLGEQAQLKLAGTGIAGLAMKAATGDPTALKATQIYGQTQAPKSELASLLQLYGGDYQKALDDFHSRKMDLKTEPVILAGGNQIKLQTLKGQQAQELEGTKTDNKLRVGEAKAASDKNYIQIGKAPYTQKIYLPKDPQAAAEMIKSNIEAGTVDSDVVLPHLPEEVQQALGYKKTGWVERTLGNTTKKYKKDTVQKTGVPSAKASTNLPPPAGAENDPALQAAYEQSANVAWAKKNVNNPNVTPEEKAAAVKILKYYGL